MILDRRYVRGALGVLCALALIVAGCGGDDGPTKSSKQKLDGKVVIRNNTDSELIVEYFDEEGGVVIKANVEGNTLQEISPAPLKAGTELTVKITALTATDLVTNAPFANVDVTIDGDQRICILRVEGAAVYSGLIEWELC